MKALFTLACCAFAFLATTAQEPRRPEPNVEAHAGRPGPWDQDVAVWRVERDGKVERLGVFERAGVATLARLQDGRMIAAHQHFPADSAADFDKVAIHFSEDDGRNWTRAEVIQVAGLPEGMRFPFDPTLVLLPNGRIRLYFTSLRDRQTPQSLPGIYSALSTDGIHYEFEPGMRFGIDGRRVIDCAVVLHRGVFHLFAPDNGAGGWRSNESESVDGRGYHAVSDDGLNFRRVDDVQIEGAHRQWLGCAQSDGQIITFYGTGGGVWTATSEDGVSWKTSFVLGVRGADPGVIALLDGSLVLVGTTPPRPGTRDDRVR